MDITGLTAEQRDAKEWAAEFAKRFIEPIALELDKNPSSPAREKFIKEAAQAGAFHNLLPEPFGGTAKDLLTGVIIAEEMAAACVGCYMLVGATGLGLTPILLSMDGAAMGRFIPHMIESWESDTPKLAALAATEPTGGGSDIINGNPETNLTTRVEAKDGGWLINGQKIFISNGSLASQITVFAAHDTKASIRDTWSCFVVTPDMDGFSVGQTFDKMGQRACPADELVFDDVWVPEENRVGEQGGGWALNRVIMSVTRTPVAAMALGIARSAYEKALEYAEVRVQGGKPIVRHQAMQLMLADMAIRVEAARGLVHKAARAASAGTPSLKLSSMAKTYASDAAVANALDAIQILGGYGYMHEYGVEKLLRDAKLTQIYEGTGQINRFEIMESIEAERSKG